MHQYSLEEQSSIIKFGKEFIENSTGKPVVAHRAGGYGFNENTLTACSEAGIEIDSSNFYGHPNCKTVVTKNRINKTSAVSEVPVTSFFHNEKLLKLGPDWISNEDILLTINKLTEDKEIETITMMLHSYSLTRTEDNFNSFKLDENKVEKFKCLLSSIKSIPALK